MDIQLKSLIGVPLLPGIASATEAGLFHDDGTPTPYFHRQMEAGGEPEILRGMKVIASRKDDQGEWQRLEGDICITLKIGISPAGLVDGYMFRFKPAPGRAGAETPASVAEAKRPNVPHQFPQARFFTPASQQFLLR